MQVGAVLCLPSVVSLEVPERQARSRTSGLLLLCFLHSSSISYILGFPDTFVLKGMLSRWKNSLKTTVPGDRFPDGFSPYKHTQLEICPTKMI